MPEAPYRNDCRCTLQCLNAVIYTTTVSVPASYTEMSAF